MHNSQRNKQYYAKKNLSDNYRIPFQNDRMIESLDFWPIFSKIEEMNEIVSTTHRWKYVS